MAGSVVTARYIWKSKFKVDLAKSPMAIRADEMKDPRGDIFANIRRMVMVIYSKHNDFLGVANV